LNDGCSYTPASDSWTAVTTNGAPTPRQLHTAVWTGSAMIVWGGQDYDGNSLGDGGLYNPTLNSWTAVTTNGAPVKRVWHTAVWTGTNMIVWGGNNGLGGPGTIMNTGGSYNPSSNSWTVVTTNGAPSARQLHTAVWTGSQMIIWGGDGGINTGGVYNPSSNSWTTVTTSGAPVGRGYHTAVWTGSEMIVWGGESASGLLNDGGRYNPANNSWIAVTTTGAPGPRFFHTAVWTGTEMIVWGGTSNNGVNVLNDGGRYNPVTGTWTATSIVGAPPARDSHTAVWTGSQMLVFGGATLSTGLNDTWSYYTPGAVLYLYERP
jgi:N-acetylneuraminic acid mutarotase